MKVHTAAAISLLGVALASVCLGQVNMGLPEFPSLAGSLEANRGRIALARLDLEMRRVGGPRPGLVMDILNDPTLIGTHAWLVAVDRVCGERVISCTDLLKAVDRSQPQAGQAAPALKPEDRAYLEKQEEREALSPEKRNHLYRRALSRGGTVEFNVGESDDDAVFRIYDERIEALYPDADAYINSNQPKLNPGRFNAARRVALASASAQPVPALLALVRESAAWDVTTWSLPDRERYQALGEGPERRRLVIYALRELRRLNLRGTLEGLEEIMKLYEKDRVRAAAGNPDRMVGNGLPSSKWYQDECGKQIAEAIGDFGDRQLEREALGGRCLWDTVSEAEKTMVAKKMLAPGQMVTTESQ